MSVSVVLLQYGLPHYTRVALSSIYELEPAVDEIIMVDNGSTEEDKAWLRQEKVKLIELPSNSGYIGGTNAGWKEAKGDFVVLCNNDIALSKQCVRRLENAMHKDEKIGWVTACYQCGGWANSHTDFPYVAAKELEDSQGANRVEMNSWSASLGDEPQIEYHKFTEGTVFMVRRSLSDQIGYYWEELKTGNHTHDYGHRIAKAGYKVASCKNAVFWHSYKQPTVVSVWGRPLVHDDQKDADRLMLERWGNNWREA